MKLPAPLAPFLLVAFCAGCADPRIGEGVASVAVPAVRIPPAPPPAGGASTQPNPAPLVSMPSLPSADHADDPTLKIAAMNVRESKLVPYVLSGVMGYDGQNRYFLVGIDRARTANPSKIWAEAGYWDCEIVQIGGRDVVTLTDPGRRRLLWDDADPVQLVIRTRSGSLKTVDTFTRVAFAH